MELWRGVYRALGVEPDSDPSLPVEERRWEHLESLSDALLSREPALVVLEDLHWADPIAIWVLDHLPRALGDGRIALVATSRDHERGMPRLDGVRRVARVVQLSGLDVDGVRRLATAETTASVDAVALHARTAGNPLFVQELVRSPDGVGVIGEVLERSLDRFSDDTRVLLATAAVAGSGTPLALLALANSCTATEAGELLDPAVREGVVAEVASSGVRFHHALLAEAAGRLGDRARRARPARDRMGHRRHARRAGGRRRAPAPRRRPALQQSVPPSKPRARWPRNWSPPTSSPGPQVSSGMPGKSARNASAARSCSRTWPSTWPRSWAGWATSTLRWSSTRRPPSWRAGALTRSTRARAEAGANLWVTAFVPDLPRMRRLEDALDALPSEELRLRAMLLGRLTIIGSADVDAADQVRSWAVEAVGSPGRRVIRPSSPSRSST